MSAIAVAFEKLQGGVTGRTFVAKDESLIKIQETILKDQFERSCDYTYDSAAFRREGPAATPVDCPPQIAKREGRGKPHEGKVP